MAVGPLGGGGGQDVWRGGLMTGGGAGIVKMTRNDCV